MRYFEDTGLLMLYCMTSLFYVPIDLSFILAFLCSLILCCCCYFIRSRLIYWIFCFALILGAFICTPLFCFYPLAFYLLLRSPKKPLALAADFCYLLLFTILIPPDQIHLIFGLFAFLLAFVLSHRTGEYERLHAEFYKMRDDGYELNLLLSQKNKNLLEKQDYEIYTATLKERNRIAREIHDNVGHVLSRSILMVGAIKATQPDSGLSPIVENLDQSLNSAMDSIRSSVHDLHDDSINLEAAIQALLTDFTACPVKLDYDMGHPLPKSIKYCFISITKEALVNIIKHSNATQVHILMREHPALYQLVIKDNGHDKGPLIPVNESDSGMGLINMEDRVSALGGTFHIETDNGFKIFITIPKES